MAATSAGEAPAAHRTSASKSGLRVAVRNHRCERGAWTPAIDGRDSHALAARVKWHQRFITYLPSVSR